MRRFVAAITVQREAEYRSRELQLRDRSKSIEEFRSNPRYGGDETRVDLAFAIYALSHGSSVDQVASAIHSHDLSHKGDEKRQNQYVDRTIAKAGSIAPKVPLYLLPKNQRHIALRILQQLFAGNADLAAKLQTLQQVNEQTSSHLGSWCAA